MSPLLQAAAVGNAPRMLCVCADDFGLSPAVNSAVIDLAVRGVVTATSCMVERRAWAEGAPALASLDRRSIDVGLHLDLTDVDGSAAEAPLGPLVLSSLARQLDAARLSGQIERQLDAFERGMGRAPDYVDGHRHVHQLPQVRETLLGVLARRYSAPAPWIRSTRPASLGFKPWLIHALGGQATDRQVRRQSLRGNCRLLGVYDFSDSAQAYRRRMQAWLQQARDGDLLMCHPAMVAPVGDAIGGARVVEYQVLQGWHAMVDSTVSTDARRITSVPLSRVLDAMPACDLAPAHGERESGPP